MTKYFTNRSKTLKAAKIRDSYFQEILSMENGSQESAYPPSKAKIYKVKLLEVESALLKQKMKELDRYSLAS